MEASAAELPARELLYEHAYLVARGVRPLAIAGECDSAKARSVQSMLAGVAMAQVLTFVVAAPGDRATFGFARAMWAIDLYRWAVETAPRLQLDRIIGLLCGYDSDAIRHFDELTHSLDDVNKYEASNACSKCLALGASVSYHGKDTCGLESAEHMHRQCKTCGHEWAELPADS